MRSKRSPIARALLLTAPPGGGAPGTGPALVGAVTGTCRFVEGTTGQPADGTLVDGTFTGTEFRVVSGVLHVAGTLSGTCTGGSAGPAFEQEVTTTVTTAVVRGPGSCRTLRLVIGAMDLDREGLVVHTDDAVIDVTAESGPGHLRGNLLEAVGTALDIGAPAPHVAELLDQFLAIPR